MKKERKFGLKEFPRPLGRCNGVGKGAGQTGDRKL